MPYSRSMFIIGMGLTLWFVQGGPMSASVLANTSEDKNLILAASTDSAESKTEPSPTRIPEEMSPDRPRRALLREREDRPDRIGQADRPASPPGSEGHGRGQPSQPRNLSPEQIQETLEILQEQNPQLARRLREALDQQPELAQRLLANHWPRIQRLIDLKKNNPRMFRLTLDEFRQQREMLDTARQLRQTKDPQEQTELRMQLRKQAQKLFDLRLELKRRELELLEKRVQEMRENLEQTQQQRESRIEKQLDELQNTKHPLRPAHPGEEP